MTQVARSSTRVAGFANPELDFQLLRQLGSVSYGGASVGQCLEMARRIGQGGPEAFVQSFGDLGRSLEKDGLRRKGKGCAVSARDQLFMACNAYRAAEYFAAVDAPEHGELGLRSRDCFRQAMALSPHSLEAFFVRHDGAGLPAYFISPDPGGPARKTLIAVSGYDGSMEETFFQIGRAALERGLNLCLFAGPGQMDSLRFAPGLCFEPDYERPVSALLDSLLLRPEVDPERVALYGISIGGYFAPRAVSQEKRIKALIANSPVVDYHAYMCGIVGYDPLTDEQDFGIEDFPFIPDEQMPPHIKAASRGLMLRFGQSSFREVFRRLQDFTLEGRLEEIDCPCLAMVGEGEGPEVLSQFQRFCEGVCGKVTQRIFTQAEGAEAHCQMGNLPLAAAELLDWLQETLA